MHSLLWVSDSSRRGLELQASSLQQLLNLLVPLLRRESESCVSILIGRADICTAFYQELYHLCVAFVGRDMQRSVPVMIRCIDSTSLAKQQL